VSKIDTSISNFNDIAKTFVLFENRLEMIPRQFVWFWCRQVIAIADSMLEFFLGKQCPKS